MVEEVKEAEETDEVNQFDITKLNKSELLEYAATLEAKLADNELDSAAKEVAFVQVEEQVEEEEATRGTTKTVTGEEVAVQESSVRPVQIAEWLKISRGVDIKPSDIFMQGSDGFRVTYTVQSGRYSGYPDKNQQWSILLDVGTKQLVTPSPHEHEYHYPRVGGLTDRSAGKICSCSKKE